jgi:SP family arabinose:H+ symporter-like MFS transporter
MAFSRLVVRGTIVGALGGFLFGFDTAVIAGTTSILTSVFNLSATQLGLTVSIALWGTVAGALGAGSLGQWIGGRNALRIMAALYLVSAIGCALAPTWLLLLLARFVGGLGIGGSSVLGPVFIAELAPANLRGRLVGVFQINVVIGILAAYLSNFVISLQQFGSLEWRWDLGVAAAPAVIFFILLFRVPQSPRWLASKGRLQEAREVLHSRGSHNVTQELEEALTQASTQHTEHTEKLFQRRYGKPIFLAIMIGMFNQLAGINAILYYLNDIFAAAGFSRFSSNLQAVAIGMMNLVATIAAVTVIDRFGRKRLLLVGSIGMALCLAGVASIFYYHRHNEYLIWLLIAYIAFFASSQGAVIWVYISEVFPTAVRSKGQSVGSSAHWVMNAILSGVFPVIAKYSGAVPFLLFSSMMLLQFVVVWKSFPETKGKTLEELEHELSLA